MPASVSCFTTWRDVERIDQVWVKSRVPAPAPDLSAFGGRPADGPRHPVPGMDPTPCTQQGGVPGPWYDRLPHFRLGFSPSAGAEIQLVAREGKMATLRMPSGEMRMVDVRCRATVGGVGNAEQSNIHWGKAGRMRWKGVRPTVRGVVMNPHDHPHGGGEGRTSGGRHPVSPWGKPEGRTRDKNKASSKLIVRRRKSGKKR